MITATENRRLTRIGPGTPMGELMRRYWHPVCLAEHLPKPDGDPLRLRILGQGFVAFRDTSGRVGVLDELCMHRRASLAMGRVEDNGIRCLYHGWKFGVDGAIQETPNHCDDRFRQRQRAPAYPAREAGGLVWAYFGPKEKEPPFTQHGFFAGPDENRCNFLIKTPANYLQLWEGGTDSSHVGILHCNLANPEWKNKADFVPEEDDYSSVTLAVGDNAPELEIENTAYGYHYAARRKGPALADGTPTASTRVTAMFMPTGRIIPLPQYQFWMYETPADDGWTNTFLVCHGPKPFDREKQKKVLGLDDERLWNERDCIYRATSDNLYIQDRALMNVTWSGLAGLMPEDASIAVSMGPVVDRENETLVAADAAVVRLRERLSENLRRFEAGEEPIGLIADMRKVRSLADTNVPHGERWQDLVPHNMATGPQTGARQLA